MTLYSIKNSYAPAEFAKRWNSRGFSKKSYMVPEFLSSCHPDNYRLFMFPDKRRKLFKEFRSDQRCAVAVKYNRID